MVRLDNRLILGVKTYHLHGYTSDVTDVEQLQRKQRSQNKRQNEHNSDKTKKNFTGFYTEVNPDNPVILN